MLVLSKFQIGKTLVVPKFQIGKTLVLSKFQIGKTLVLSKFQVKIAKIRPLCSKFGESSSQGIY